jgi:hypothetical protein
MTIQPFQNLIVNSIDAALLEGGWEDTQLYFEQLTPLVILSQTADETGKSVTQVEDETNKAMENPEATQPETENIQQMSSDEDDISFIRNVGTTNAFFDREYK